MANLIIQFYLFSFQQTAYLQCVTQATANYVNSTTPSSLPIFNSTASKIFVSNSTVNDILSDITTVSPAILTTTEISNDILEEFCGPVWDYSSRELLLNLWSVVYWTLQLLTWIVLPLMQSYSMAGDFTLLGRLKSAFVGNAIYYGTFGGLFLIIMIYVAIRSSLDWDNLKVICITASNTWGLFLLVILLGYGLIEIPRSCYHKSLDERSLEYLYFKIGKLSAEKCEAEESLEDILDEIGSAYQTLQISEGHIYNEYMKEILSKCPSEWRNNLIDRFYNTNSNTQTQNLIALNEKSLVRMNQTIKKVMQTHHRVHCQYMNVIKDAIELENIGRNKMNINRYHKLALPNHASSHHHLIQLLFTHVYTPKVEWLWKCKFREPCFARLSFILVALSAMVIWSEMTFSIHNPPLSIFAYTFFWFRNNGHYVLIEVSCHYFCVYHQHNHYHCILTIYFFLFQFAVSFSHSDFLSLCLYLLHHF